MSTNLVVQLAAQAGRLILENGGEVFRVEETSGKICDSFGVRGSQTYATPTSLVVSAVDAEGFSHTAVERITSRGVNLDKVDAVNRLSRQLERDHPGIAEARLRLMEIRESKRYGNLLVIFFSALACAAFALLFGGSPRDMIPAFLSGGLIRFSMIQLARIKLNDFFINVTGGFIATIGGGIPVLLGLPVNMDAVVSSAIMQLVPGMMVTNAVRDITAGDLISGISRFMEASFVAIAIACGTALGYTLLS